MTQWRSELALAESLAREAGAAALHLQSTRSVRYKPDGQGPVTDADLEADRLICAGVLAQFPHDCIVSEESFSLENGTLVPSADRIWFIDPIDGTSDYVKGQCDYAVMIGLAVQGVPVMGVVYQPISNTLWRAADNLSERVDTDGSVTALDVRNKQTPQEGPVIAISRNHPNVLQDNLVKILGASRVIPKGSVGLKIALIADGIADFYMAGTRRIKLWDTCAPHVILREAGGLLLAIDGTPLNYNSSIAHGRLIYATTPHCYALAKKPLMDATGRSPYPASVV